MINGRLHREMTYHGKKILIDACELDNGRIEVMTLYSEGKRSGEEIECVIVDDIDQAERAWNEMRYKYENQPEAELKGRYAKLRDDLKIALAKGKEAEGNDDGGTCNFDACAVKLPRWNRKLIEQAAKEAGTTVFVWNLYGNKDYVFNPDTHGQGNKRSRNADAMTAAMVNMGYDALEYSAMD